MRGAKGVQNFEKSKTLKVAGYGSKHVETKFPRHENDPTQNLGPYEGAKELQNFEKSKNLKDAGNFSKHLEMKFSPHKNDPTQNLGPHEGG